MPCVVKYVHPNLLEGLACGDMYNFFPFRSGWMESRCRGFCPPLLAAMCLIKTEMVCQV